MSGKIGVAIIGSGIFVKEQHLPAVLKCPELSLKAIYSRSLKSAQNVSESLSDVALYSDDSEQAYADLLRREDVQAVIIALTIPVQPNFIKQALVAGKHVLAEKPLAKDVSTGIELVKYYHANTDTSKVTFSVAEQFRYLEAFNYAAEEIGKLGRVLGAHLKLHTSVKLGSKYIETEWRKTPEYQGGFLLDGGVHFVAALRLMLAGGGVKVQKVSAHSAQLQKHLPPVDTVDAALSLDNGATGTLSLSFGTSLEANETIVACEGGTVSVARDKVTIKPVEGTSTTSAETRVEDKPDGPGGVAIEVFAWAKSIVAGKQEPKQKPEEALADLELLEAMLKSGEKGGEPVGLQYQI
ncbi:hypothetical protein BJ170DRAFT_627985 [Xylariales sp. AK1849]|nr:hypothetical protein BJ170DRAFT_627985 [Xylariales sp. AK1849]